MHLPDNSTSNEPTGKPHILVLEDESSIANGLKLVLTEEGYRVDLANTGERALSSLSEKSFDLLLADLRLPDIDGMEVVRQAKEERPEIEIIVLTGYPSVPTAVEALKAGVFDYLPKPFTDENLIGAVEKALYQQRDALSKEPPEPVEAEVAPRERALGEIKILVMEDEQSVAQGLKLVLKEEGYSVDLATTGQAALSSMGADDFDLLVADLRLPDIDGMEVIRRAKEDRPEMEVVVITGYPSVNSALDALRIGVSDYLPKPFTEQEIRAAVERTLREKLKPFVIRILEPEVPEERKPFRTGFYVCHCGLNIAGKVDVEEVAAFAREQENVAVARDYKFMCSDPGQEMIEKDIKEFDLNRVVVASCSPRLHEKTFQAACQRAGLNPYNFQMASVREQVSWVTPDPDEATRKAKALVSAALRRVRHHRKLSSREVRVHPDVLIVGGGIAGMEASLDIAAAGHRAYLVERQPTIGGHMLQFDKTFPTLDCAACIGTPKMTAVAQNPHIELLTYSEVTEVSGYIGNYKVKIHRKPRYVKEGVCTGCGECEKVCPVSTRSEWEVGLADRRAIYRAFPQAVPVTFTVDKMDRAPCVARCPAGVNIQGYVQLIGQGKYTEAVRLIMERLPLPGVLGRVCPHPCETDCRRIELDEAVSVRELKRFAADQVSLEDLPRPEIVDRLERVAVVGSGPAGLTVAYYLRLKGYQVTMFEALSELGGMLKVGIPDYRLPPEVLKREIDYLVAAGIEVRTSKRLGTDFTLPDLEKEGFKAVFLGIGAHRSLKLNIPGEEIYEGVLDAVDFLREANLGKREPPGERVVVIGGGNVAIDAARTALRLGSKEVTIVYRRTREEMPAYEEEIEDALAEGIKILYLAAPVGIEGNEGRITGLECMVTKLTEPDESGRMRPVVVEGSEFVIACDAVLPAIGQRPDVAWAGDGAALETDPWGTIIADPHTMQTSIPHVFAGGDAVTGPATAVEAVATGHRATEAIHRYLNREDLEELAREVSARETAEGSWREVPKELAGEARAHAAHRDPEERLDSFVEVNRGLSEEDAQREARRCLSCGICCECMECVRVCEPNAIDHGMEAQELEIEVGSIILATGYDLWDPTPMKQFGYGTFPNVLTSLEFERLNNTTGPTDGQIMMRDGNGNFTGPPESVAIIHCVGSRDKHYHEYCSQVCCMYALKYGHLIKDKVGHDTKIFDFYIDMRCVGKGYEEFYARCQEEGTTFIRGKPSEITDRALSPEEEGKLVVISEDTLLGKCFRIPVDMVILCAAMEPRDDTAKVARIFGLSQSADGFFLEEHPKLAPLSTATSGVFLAGVCQGPKDIPETVAQASGAAAKALELATRGVVEVSPVISWIDPDVCAGCQTCIEVCPYSAIDFDERRGISVINESVCKGCGSCSAACPSGAAQTRHFTKRQIFSEIDGLMEALYQVGI